MRIGNFLIKLEYLMAALVLWWAWGALRSREALAPMHQVTRSEIKLQERAPWEPITSNYRIPEELVRIIPEDPYGGSLCPSCVEKRQ